MYIDINCDVGEGLDNEHLIMPLISSCNISCGAHAGSIETIDKVLGLAKQYKVKVGAHPSYPDRAHFGRKILPMSSDALKETLIQQLALFKERAALQKIEVNHVKPHGALYNIAAVDEVIAKMILEAIQFVFGKIKIYAPFNAAISKQAYQNNFKVVYEVFADRNYNSDLSLVSRNLSNAVLSDPQEIVKHVLLLKKGFVKTIQGNEHPITADTFCVHGDNKAVISILKALNDLNV